jgi:5-methylcytosine-specific restriction endonuclease McrA
LGIWGLLVGAIVAALLAVSSVSSKARAYAEWVNSPAFLRSAEWSRLRYDVLAASNGRCCLCGRSAAQGVVLSVDHIKPRRRFPSLALSRSNLQVLCSSCNWGKGNRCHDWRPRAR